MPQRKTSGGSELLAGSGLMSSGPSSPRLLRALEPLLSAYLLLTRPEELDGVCYGLLPLGGAVGLNLCFSLLPADSPFQYEAHFHEDGYIALPKSIFPRR